MVWNTGVVNEHQDSNLDTAPRKLLRYTGCDLASPLLLTRKKFGRRDGAGLRLLLALRAAFVVDADRGLHLPPAPGGRRGVRCRCGPRPPASAEPSPDLISWVAVVQWHSHRQIGYNHAHPRNRICKLDTGLTLCCSVRQPPQSIKRQEYRENAHDGFNGPAFQIGHYEAKLSMVTIRDVAKESGFSSTTVSIVLNDAPLARYIPLVTKKRIERAAEKLGYRPNQFARSLRSKRSHTVGVMVFDMTDPYCPLVLRGIENTLYEASYMPILTDVQHERSRFERYLEMLLDRRVEGLIVLANWLFLNIN